VPVQSDRPRFARPRRFLRNRRMLIASAVAAMVLAAPAVSYAATSFTDVKSGSPFFGDVKAAVGANLMSGCGKGKFCPTTPALRQDLARLANRLGALSAGTTPVVNAKTALTAGSALTAASADHAAAADNATNAKHALTAGSAVSAGDSASLGGVAASNYLQNSGKVLIGAPANGWTDFGSPTSTTFTYRTDTTRVSQVSISTTLLEAGFSTPTGMYGNQLALDGVQLCYDATHSADISQVAINVRGATAGIGSSLYLAGDYATRSDSACRTYAVSSPTWLPPNDSVSVFVGVRFAANSYIDLASATLILEPSGSSLQPLSRPLTQGPLTVLKPVKGGLLLTTK